jgi:uncharacterized membrane protein YkvA (DUF1232 family)
MAEIAQFVQHGAATITPKILKGVYKKLPMLKLKFADLNDPRYPHLSEQLMFLADVVEDFAEGVEEDVPYGVVARAAFAIIYANRQMDLIPDSVPEFGHADDSGVVRAVLILNEKILVAYAARHKIKFDRNVLLIRRIFHFTRLLKNPPWLSTEGFLLKCQTSFTTPQ